MEFLVTMTTHVPEGTPGQAVTETELIEFVKERAAAYKYPRTIEFRDSLPKGATGKILKKELRPS